MDRGQGMNQAALSGIPETEWITPGHLGCQGCGAALAMRFVLKALGEKTIIVLPACCWSIIAGPFPYSSVKVPLIHTAFETAAPVACGIRAALDVQGDHETTVLAWAGDGATFDIGLQALSAAAERNENILYICYDNEGYGNTGQQFSGATPHAARTATSRGPRGFSGYKKDLFSIWAAHKPAYVATVIGAEPLDLARKVEKAMQLKGPRLIIALAPCPTGWDYDPRESADIGKLAVTTGIWPLKEYVDGKVVHTKIPHRRQPVEAYLKTQGRFAHLFEPQRNEALLQELQQAVDQYWAGIEP